MSQEYSTTMGEDRISEAKPYQVKDLHIEHPDILLTGNDDWCLLAYPARKSVFAACSTAFAARFATDNAEDHIPNEGPPPYNHLPVLRLDETPKTIRNVLVHIFPEPSMPSNLTVEELIDVYRVAHKYGIRRLYDWMKDKLLWSMSDGNSIAFLRMYAAASVVGDAALAKKAMGKLMTRSDWKLERDKDDKWICNLKGEIPQGLDMSGAAAAAFWEGVAKGKSCQHCGQQPFDL